MKIDGHLWVDGEIHVVLYHFRGDRSVRLEIAESGKPVEAGITIFTGAIDARALIRELEEAALWTESSGAT